MNKNLKWLCYILIIAVQIVSFIRHPVLVNAEDSRYDEDQNIALNKPAIAQSYSKNELPSYAVDNNPYTYWGATPYSQWWQVDLGGMYDISRIHITNYFLDSRYYHYKIYSSKDGINFTEIAAKENNNPATSEGDMYEVNETARYLRVRMTENSANEGVHICDFKAYGRPSSEQEPIIPPIETVDLEFTPYAEKEDTIASVRGVIERTVGSKVAQNIQLELIPQIDNKDVFELSSEDGKLTVKGSSGTALAFGFNWYLKYYCNAHFSWTGEQLNIPDPLPELEEPIIIQSPYQYRYYLNYCTHSYSMAFWDWERWEKEIDWMALNGINLVLDVTGHEEVWRRTLKRLGYSDQEAKEFICGPAYFAWMWMQNMSGFGGPLTDAWFKERVELGQRIHQRMLSLGINPVLQGYSGMVPNNFKDKYPDTTIIPQGEWCGFERPDMLSPLDPMFEEIAEIFYEEQRKLFGSDIHVYSVDPFHEGGNTGGLNLKEASKAIHDIMLESDPNAVWLLQGWQNNPKTELLQGLYKDKALVLDLFANSRPSWQNRRDHINNEAFYGTPWIWCALDNFGGRMGLYGNLERLADWPVQALNSPYGGKISGIGLTMEAIETNSVLYDLATEMAWRSEAPDVDEWLDKFIDRRYGKYSEKAKEAWKLLKDSAFYCNTNQEGATETVINARPSESINRVSSWGTTTLYYDPRAVEEASQLLLEEYDSLSGNDAYLYDLVDVTRQVLANTAQVYHRKFIQAYRDKDINEFELWSGKFLDLIEMQDTLLNTRKEFLLGTWLESAKSWGKTDMEKDLFEANARTLITTWGGKKQSASLHDYSNRQWAGLTKDFYGARWELYINSLREALQKGTHPQSIDWYKWELDWINRTNQYSTTPRGDIKQIATDALSNFMIPSEIPDNTSNIASTAICSDPKVNDGIDNGDDAGTLIVSARPPYTITFRWVEGQSFDSVVLKSWWCEGQAPTNWDIEVSDDGNTNWKKVASSGDVIWEVSGATVGAKEVNFDRVVNKKGLRLIINKAKFTWGHFVVNEIEIYDKAAELIDVNNDGIVNVGDLGIVSRYYGCKSGDVEWEAALRADVNSDNEVGIEDLSYVALEIITKSFVTKIKDFERFPNR